MKIPLFNLSWVILCACTLTTQAQTFTWANVLKDSTGLTAGVTSFIPGGTYNVQQVATDHHNHTIATGAYTQTMHTGSYTFTAAGNNINGYLVKYDSSGNVLWAVNIPFDSAGNATISPLSVAVDKDDNIFIGGFYTSSVINFTATDSLVNTVSSTSFLAKYNSSGQFQWATDNKSDFSSCSAVTTDQDGNVIWAGMYFYTANFAGIVDSGAGFINFYIAKYTTNGKPLWANSGSVLNGASSDGLLQSLTADAAGNIYAAGHTPGSIVFGSDTVQDASNWTKAFVIKFDSTGSMKWSNTENSGRLGNYANSVNVDYSGNVYICGQLLDSTFTNSMPFIAKYDINGTKKWLNKYGSNNAVANGMSLDANGDPYVIGNYVSNITIGSTTFSSGKNSMYLAKFNTNGDAVWAMTSKNGQASGNSISVDQNNGNISIAGYTFSPDSFNAQSVISSVPGTNNNYVAYLSMHPKATGIAALASSPSVVIYPNPAENELYIAHATANTTARIYNVTGQPVYYGIITSSTQTINISELAAGVYTIQLTDAAGTKQTTPFVKR